MKAKEIVQLFVGTSRFSHEMLPLSVSAMDDGA